MLEEKLKYAIHFCKSIDTDDYARIALTGEPAADDSSDETDNEDADSFASDSTQDYLTGHWKYKEQLLKALRQNAKMTMKPRTVEVSE